MMFKHFLTGFVLWSLLSVTLSASADFKNTERTYVFNKPVDAISIEFPDFKNHQPETDELMVDFYLSALIKDSWTPWQQLHIEKESDPLLAESNLLIFSEPVYRIKIKGSVKNFQLHPITVSKDRVKTEVAAAASVSAPRIISRTQWGADESLLYGETDSQHPETEKEAPDNASAADTGATEPERLKQCRSDHKQYPEEFQVTKTLTTNPEGKTYRWPVQYSQEIKLLVVHHTAGKVLGDGRDPIERMRAIYKYHSDSRGWGDIGYHYVIDENGQIYEGRAGGKHVVGGHVYCHNVSTLGIALMGNFEIEKPSQPQVKSLQWLLNYLSKSYSLDISKDVIFHGREQKPIVGHRDLVSTACPGYYLYSVLGQVAGNIKSGALDAPVYFPQKTNEKTIAKTSTPTAPAAETSSLSAVGSLEISGRPLSKIPLQIKYKTLTDKNRRSRIGKIIRSDSTIDVWQKMDGRWLQVKQELFLPEELKAGRSAAVDLQITLPSREGFYALQIGNLKYSIKTEGRPLRQDVEKSGITSYIKTNASPVTADKTEPELIPARDQTDGKNIRLRLSVKSNSVSLKTDAKMLINNQTHNINSLQLSKTGEGCRYQLSNKTIVQPVVRITSGNHIVSVTPVAGEARSYRDTIECRVINGELVIINELPLEQYLWGLAEEPEHEPWEKLRAFAIAARTYAAHYLQEQYRKFPGLPYDGSDSPADFQSYAGYNREIKSPNWVKAVKDTEDLVITRNFQIIRAAYYSSNDGRTRTPAEIGWSNFPFAEVFPGRSDPWCRGFPLRGHGVGMSGCGAEGQANEGKTAEEILQFYYVGTKLEKLK